MKICLLAIAGMSILAGCASVPPPPSEMKSESEGSPGYNCYYKQKCPNYVWGAAADAQHNSNHKSKTVAEQIMANEQERVIAGSEPKSGKCFPSFSLNMNVIQKIDKNHFGVAQESAYVSELGIVEMNSHQPHDGDRLNTGVKFIESEIKKGADGFNHTVDIWKECQWPSSNVQ